MTAPIPPLFGGPARGGSSNVAPPAPSGPPHLVEFKAGRMTLRDRMVTPDRRKGLVYVFQSEDGLAHFCWKDRTSGTVEEDLLVFPDDVTFTFEKEKARGGRVYLLRFKSNPSRKFFFWSQEPKTDNDEKICERVLEAINNPSQALANLTSSRGQGEGSSRSGGLEGLLPPGATSPLGGAFNEADLQALLGAYSPQQLLSWMNSNANSRPGSGATPFGTSASSNNKSNNSNSAGNTSTQATAPATQAATSNSNDSKKNTQQTNLGPSDLAAALRAIGATIAQGKTAETSSSNEKSSSPPLSEILTGDAVINSAAASGSATDRLLAHLPSSGLPADEELVASLRSPQFQQAANMLTAALETGQLGPLLIEMGVAREAVAGVHDVETFLRALQQHHASTPATPAANGNANGAPKQAPPAPKKEKDNGTTDTANGQAKKDSNTDGSSPMEH